MAKQGEIDYLRNIGPKGEAHAFDKPFSDAHCGLYLTDLGTVMSLMPQPPARVLDLGVGTGWTSVFLAKRGYDVVGQDIAPDMIDLANRNKDRHGLENLRFVVSDFEMLDFPGQFDAAIFYDCLHHCIEEQKAMQSAYDALKPGGMLITVEPGKGHAESEAAKKATEQFDVTERDMPPQFIIEVAKKIGFTGWKVYQRHLAPTELTPFTRTSVWSSVKSLVRRLRRSYMRQTNIVVLTK